MMRFAPLSRMERVLEVRGAGYGAGQVRRHGLRGGRGMRLARSGGMY